MANIPSTILTIGAAIVIACLTVIPLGAAVAQDQKEFSCDIFGSGFTPHPGFQYVCCYPGTLPIPGEMRCNKSGSSDEPIFQATPSDGQGTDRQCIAKGQICVIGGISCCAGSCTGTFPNTYCQ